MKNTSSEFNSKIPRRPPVHPAAQNMTEHAERNSKPAWALLPIASIMLLLTQTVVAQGNLVFNGGFEAGSTGWTLVRGAHVTGAASRPGLAVFLASTNASPANEPTASQTINSLIAATRYLVSGEYLVQKDRGGASPTNASFGVALNGAYLYQIAASPVGNWQSFSFFYTANSSSALLSLSSQINGTGVEYYIDNILIQAVPEPSSLALCLTGGLIAASQFIRRRKIQTRHLRRSSRCPAPSTEPSVTGKRLATSNSHWREFPFAPHFQGTVRGGIKTSPSDAGLFISFPRIHARGFAGLNHKLPRPGLVHNNSSTAVDLSLRWARLSADGCPRERG